MSIQEDEAEKAEDNNRRVQNFIRTVQPMFVSGTYIIMDSDSVRLVVGEKIGEDFVPKGHLVMSHGSLSKLFIAIEEMLQKAQGASAAAKAKGN